MIKILILLPVLMTSACGMQGDLYLPDKGPDAVSEDNAAKFREPLIKSWMNSLSQDFPIAALVSACNSPAITSTYRLALENPESQPASPRLNQRLPGADIMALDVVRKT